MEVLFMQPRCFLLLADNPLTLAQLRAEIEDLGEETRCQTALTAEEAQAYGLIDKVIYKR